VAIEQEGSKPSLNALGQYNGAVQAVGLCCACSGFRLSWGREWGGDTSLCLPPKLTKRRHIGRPQQQGTKKLVAGGGGNG
jgi:hypothetical protein